MPFPLLALIPLALELASHAAPKIAGMLAGDDAEKVAEQVVGVAKKITGLDNPRDAVDAINADPALALELQKALIGLEVVKEQEETKRLEVVNQQMGREVESEDEYVRHWRPFWGYVSATAFGTMMFGFMGIAGWAIIWRTADAPEIISSLSGLITSTMPIWAIALTVLGVSVAKRSRDKAVAAGQTTAPGLLGALTQRLMRPDTSGGADADAKLFK